MNKPATRATRTPAFEASQAVSWARRRFADPAGRQRASPAAVCVAPWGLLNKSAIIPPAEAGGYRLYDPSGVSPTRCFGGSQSDTRASFQLPGPRPTPKPVGRPGQSSRGERAFPGRQSAAATVAGDAREPFVSPPGGSSTNRGLSPRLKPGAIVCMTPPGSCQPGALADPARSRNLQEPAIICMTPPGSCQLGTVAGPARPRNDGKPTRPWPPLS